MGGIRILDPRPGSRQGCCTSARLMGTRHCRVGSSGRVLQQGCSHAGVRPLVPEASDSGMPHATGVSLQSMVHANQLTTNQLTNKGNDCQVATETL